MPAPEPFVPDGILPPGGALARVRQSWLPGVSQRSETLPSACLRKSANSSSVPLLYTSPPLMMSSGVSFARIQRTNV